MSKLSFVFVLILVLLVWFVKIETQTSGWLETCYVVKAGLELLIILFSTFQMLGLKV